MTSHRRPGRALALGASLAVPLGVLVGVPGEASAARAERPTASVADGTLTISGTARNDRVTVDFTAVDRVAVSLGRNEPARSFSRTRFDAIVVRLRGGDDQVVTTTGPAPQLDLPMTVTGGAGADQVLGGNRSDTLEGGEGDDVVLGGGGIDVLFGGGGDDFVNGNVGTDTEFLGAGDDVAGWIPGEGNDVVSGERGQDTLVFTGSDGAESFSAAALGESVVFLRSLGNIRMDLVGLERIEVEALGGADLMAVNDLTGTGVTTVAVDLAATTGAADGAADVVVANGTPGGDAVEVGARDATVTVAGLPPAIEVAGGEQADTLQVSTLGGDDSVVVADAARALMTVAFDLGADD